MWSRKQSEAAKRLAPIMEKERKQSELAPILEKESAKTSGTEWLRYTETIQQITTLITGFELNNEEAEELKRNMSGETHKQLSGNSVCQLKAMDVRTDEWCTVMLIQKSDDKLILDWTHCTGCNVGKTIDFDFRNSFWKDNDHSGCDRVFYGTRLV